MCFLIATGVSQPSILPQPFQTFRVTWYSLDSSCEFQSTTTKAFSATNESCVISQPMKCVAQGGELFVGSGCFYYKDLPVISPSWATVYYYTNPTYNCQNEISVISSYQNGNCVGLTINKRAQPPSQTYPDGTGVIVGCIITTEGNPVVRFTTYSTFTCETGTEIYQSVVETPVGCYTDVQYGFSEYGYCGTVATSALPTGGTGTISQTSSMNETQSPSSTQASSQTTQATSTQATSTQASTQTSGAGGLVISLCHCMLSLALMGML